MHNLFLGEFQHHCRQVWGIDIKASEKMSKKAQPHSPEQQAIELEKGRRAIEKQSFNALKQLRKGYVVALALLNEVSVEGQLFTKAAYAHALLNWYRENPGIAIRILTVMKDSATDFVLKGAEGPDVSKFCILSKECLEKIQADIKKTSFPSWMVRPPHNFGSPSHGKLKADQWRTVCTVSLVLTLVPLWGGISSKEREKLLLSNFIDLVIAVETSVRRSTSPSRIALYRFHMTRYLKTLRQLFSDHPLQPNHHLSLHLDECLLLFGPVHGWWAFPFERYNGIIRDLNTNNKSGEMEKTFLKYFCIGANLRALSSSIKFPQTEIYDAMMKSFHRAFIEPTHGSLLNNLLSTGANTSTSIPNTVRTMDLADDVYDALIRRLNAGATADQPLFVRWDSDGKDSHLLVDSRVNSIKSVKSDGVSFSIPKSSVGNSFVLFKPYTAVGQRGIVTAGQICQIFVHSRVTTTGCSVEETFIVVEEYEGLSTLDQTKDPFLVFENLGARLYYNRFKIHPHVLKLSDIISHFSCLAYIPEGIAEECIVARSLDRS
ncbi:hypothetical protein SERLA73DRAFT_183683 [Serpula lacrymans var. lacrymans S7.3]|uniref:DUF4218 domain-containing protein n=2 Tax=Serpula lacrymans var. lacrymans TaxID=341189 RepID=F8Q3J4_SERL3|nr:uncharacterized protein SERLADRAFT_470996 [Serpula lacrymans var. lacrymans S7.9]EGN97079.1 hypothetical protein SERLA73DRAFT_183683 [Serpula lacrymans var. lacrymans S7.3]EGO22686.1 hypothetical protein SERLADRAFT_470996 [Serpula lacrymans var. lacrymans S7.9]